tara:strand:- start:1807 stop:2406 length:600 start_codon:yes stop_codon:yes gene_type:complete
MIGIIDYGLGNINAFYNIYNENGIKLEVIKSYKDFNKNINKIILPGIGSFDKAVQLIKKNSLFDEITNFVANNNNKIIGICVGMQIFATSSAEGELTGFSFIKDNFIKFETKICPHIGWNNVELLNNNELFLGIKNNSYFYFLHSYYLKHKNQNYTVSNTNYGENFISSFKNKNVYGIQFHPEKSHVNGEKLLINFYKL